MKEKIKARLGTPELCAMLAEECNELAHAALKLRRVLDGKNPAPNVSFDEVYENIIEEYTDISFVADLLELEVDNDQIEWKTRRWLDRLEWGRTNEV